MEYILKIDKERSFSKAAAKLFISQPALSAIVKKEEEIYGVQFFNRNVKPIIPTTAGAKYLQAAEKIKKIEAGLKKDLHLIHPSNSLTIGSAAFFCSNVIPELTKGFLKYQKQHCSVNTLEGNSAGLFSLLQNGTADFVISVDVPPSSKYERLVLQRENILLAIPKAMLPSDKLLSYALNPADIISARYLKEPFPSVDLQAFSQLPFILLTKGNDMYTRAKKLFRTYGVKPSEIIYMDQLQSSFLAAKNGKGAVFIRADLLKYLEGASTLLFFKIDNTLCWREVNLFYKSKKMLTPTAQAFLKYCESEL